LEERESSVLHNRVHPWVGGPDGDMTSVPIAVNDPVFFLHHCNIDRIWATWQTKNPNELSPSTSTYPASGARRGTNLNDPMNPWLSTVTPASMLDYRPLYSYQAPNALGIMTADNGRTMRWSLSATPDYLTSWNSTSYAVGNSSTNTMVASSVSSTVFNNRCYIAMTILPNHSVVLASSSSSYDWSNNTPVSDWTSAHAPAITSFLEKPYLCYVGASQNIYVGSSSDGVAWPTNAISIGLESCNSLTLT
jgi:hypothetical protein